MTTILTIKTDKRTERRDYDLLVMPSRSAAKNILSAASEIVSDFEKENPSDAIQEISFISESTGKELATLRF